MHTDPQYVVWHDHSFRAEKKRQGDRDRRRPGDAGQYGGQIQRPQGAAPRQYVKWGHGQQLLGHGGGFAGATADAFTLFERLEAKLEKHPGQLTRACVELAKDWRTDKYLRRLEAMMIVADQDVSLTLTGNGDVLEPEDSLIGIGSGGSFALAAARALIDRDDMDAEAIARRAMEIAADICIYTNRNFTIETPLSKNT